MEEDREFMIHEKIMKRVASKSGNTIYRKRRIGDLVAMRIGDRVAFGYSLCNKKDRYNFCEDGNHIPNMGLITAKTRAIRWNSDPKVKIPPSITKQVERFMERCKKYYKNLELPVIEPMYVDYPQQYRR